MAIFKSTDKGPVALSGQEEAEILALWAQNDSLPNKKTRIRVAINDERKSRQNSGVTVDGILYGSDLNSRVELSNAYIYLVRNQGALVNVESKSGEMFSLDIKGVEAIYDAVNGYVNAVYDAARQHYDNLKILTKANIDSYDVKSLWP